MDTQLLKSLNDTPGKRPAPKVRARIAECFAEDPREAWEAYGGPSDWQSVAEGESPWSAPSVSGVWAALADTMKALLTQLEKRTLGFLVREYEGRWQLGYILELGTAKDQHYRLEVWAGGAPSPDAKFDSPQGHNEDVGPWHLPETLREVYSVHDGFGPHGEEGFAVGALLPSHQLESLPAVIGWRAKGVPIIEGECFLGFLVDSVGNRRGLYRQPAIFYKHAFEWDRHDKRASKAGKVQAVITRELAGLLRT